MSNTKTFDLTVIGGGAAGFFGAINAAQQNPKLKILLLEKSTKLLSKVKVSGGGRCNVTHHCFEPTPLSQHYPRGQKELKKLFRLFDAKETVAWFERLSVHLKTEDDGRMFPITDYSQTIIDCFLAEAKKFNIQIETSCGVEKLVHEKNHFLLHTSNQQTYHSKKVLIAMGGHPQAASYQWIEQLGHTITPLIPSLFTFNDSEKKFKDLLGIAVADAEVKIAGTKFLERGPVLITHWGLSGPAVIKLSAWAAEHLHQEKYTFTALINWTGKLGEDELRNILQQHKIKHGKQKIITNPFFGLPLRLWERLVELAEIEFLKIWGEASNKDINKLIEFLIRCPFAIKGKTTFKEEFVTCGGVDLKEIDLETMQSKKIPGLYFAGEVLNLDGETGGFNFQAAWTTAYVAAKAIAKN
ncbi:MAG: NAD(P)/FAD-dependent oxidoreductase [Cyclobacteriaceae bacterium]